MWLRNNQQQQNRNEYVNRLIDADIQATKGEGSNSILLEKAVDVMQLPNFAQGAVSVQDAAAQWAAELLAPQEGELILDACAAPGGKTCHILESASADVVALDFDEHRLKRVSENIERLQLTRKSDPRRCGGYSILVAR